MTQSSRFRVRNWYLEQDRDPDGNPEPIQGKTKNETVFKFGTTSGSRIGTGSDIGEVWDSIWICVIRHVQTDRHEGTSETQHGSGRRAGVSSSDRAVIWSSRERREGLNNSRRS
ncbi:hypothetical protein EVAR_34388_1 [Eumeta japonica]|uniref:Uncharacterized protein n=1 Tax=Eumeta variegata TaxID=151549 RepID=A0A4C1WZP0_EUMVA|nr:hypothetical protein EVAR_34388_1 [Eumeta japonica]